MKAVSPSHLVSYNKKGNITLDPEGVYAYLHKVGFRKYYDNVEESIIIQKRGAIISFSSTEKVVDAIARKLREDGVENVPSLLLSSKGVISEVMIRANIEPIEFVPLRDDKDAAIFMFRNCIVRVTKHGIYVDNTSPDNYLEGDQVVWDDDIIKHDFTMVSDDEARSSVINRFIMCVAGIKMQHIHGEHHTVNTYYRICKAIGYLLHTFKNPSNSKAVVLTDYESIVKERNMGGTGKGILMKAISYCRPTRQIDGKRLNFNSQFVLQGVMPYHKVVVLEDIKRDFSLENVYNWVTDTMEIERKYRDSIFVPFDRSPKIAITTNYLMKGIDTSILRRVYEVCLYNYFNKDYMPENEFGHFLFKEWNEDEWDRFYTFMMHCVKYYLSDPILEDAKYDDTITQIKTVKETGDDIYEFMESYVKCDVWYIARDIYTQFLFRYKYDKKDFPYRMFLGRVQAYCVLKKLFYYYKIINNKPHIMFSTKSEMSGNIEYESIVKSDEIPQDGYYEDIDIKPPF